MDFFLAFNLGSGLCPTPIPPFLGSRLRLGHASEALHTPVMCPFFFGGPMRVRQKVISVALG